VAKKLWLAFVCAGMVSVLAVLGGAARGQAASSCPDNKYVQPFVPWGDSSNYVLMPKGALESTSGWQLSGGATLVSGNEPWKVNSSRDKYSLSLPSGSSATTPTGCISLAYPFMRFFMSNSGSSKTTLKVEGITKVNGSEHTLTIGNLTAGAWQPSAQLFVGLNLLNWTPGEIAFRFTPVGSNSGWRIDDVYLDPFKAR
jgi:hypothetical protein